MEEIIRKFLVADKRWQQEPATGVVYRQGYLSTDEMRAVSVRVVVTGLRRAGFEGGWLDV